MASREGNKAEPPKASGSQAEPVFVNSSVYWPLEGTQDHQKGVLQALGFVSSGSLSVAAGRKPTRMLMQNSFGMNIASATIALVGIVFLSIHLVVNNLSLKSCPSSLSPDLCLYLGSSSNGLVSLMLIFTLLELGINMSISIMWCKGNCCDSREEISSPPSSME
uniref:Membrane spanning 4-domains A3 n=1 Tax=Sciurus vulgaris TaxID=55149 RepID=A0A8D2CY37_SCIVU